MVCLTAASVIFPGVAWRWEGSEHSIIWCRIHIWMTASCPFPKALKGPQTITFQSWYDPLLQAVSALCQTCILTLSMSHIFSTGLLFVCVFTHTQTVVCGQQRLFSWHALHTGPIFWLQKQLCYLQISSWHLCSFSFLFKFSGPGSPAQFGSHFELSTTCT